MKSDDVVGRVKTYEAIVKDENIPEPGIPESFKVLIKEMQSLGLDVKVLGENDVEVELKDTSELEDNTNFNAVELDGLDRRDSMDDEFFAPGAGYTEYDEYGDVVNKDFAEGGDTADEDSYSDSEF